MSVTYTATVICDRCKAEHTARLAGSPVSGVHARLEAFAAGWVTARGHHGDDMCPECQ